MEKVKCIEKRRLLHLIRGKGNHSDLAAYRQLTGTLRQQRQRIDRLATENSRLHMQIATLKAEVAEKDEIISESDLRLVRYAESASKYIARAAEVEKELKSLKERESMQAKPKPKCNHIYVTSWRGDQSFARCAWCGERPNPNSIDGGE